MKNRAALYLYRRERKQNNKSDAVNKGLQSAEVQNRVLTIALHHYRRFSSA